MLLTRRLVLPAALLLPVLLLPARSRAAEDPAAMVGAIYRRVTAGKGDGGGSFLWVDGKDRRAAFTRRTADLWDQAEAATPKGDMGPIEFDPVTASQDPQVTGFTLALEAKGRSRVTVAVTLRGPGYRPPDDVIRYDLVQADDRWRIDDVRGSIGGSPWSVRAILAASLKH